MQPQMRLGDDAQRAPAPGIQLDHVVAGHVLHDAAARLHDPPVSEHRSEPEHEIAGRAVERRQRARRSSSDHPTHAPVAERIERPPLACPGERAVEIGQ